MAWVVDTCVLIDVLDDDPHFGKTSAACLQNMLKDGLIVAPVSYIELAPAFVGNQQTHLRRYVPADLLRPRFCSLQSRGSSEFVVGGAGFYVLKFRKWSTSRTGDTNSGIVDTSDFDKRYIVIDDNYPPYQICTFDNPTGYYTGDPAFKNSRKKAAYSYMLTPQGI